MSKSVFDISQEYGLREHESTNVITGAIPEWALPEEALAQYQDYLGADDSFDSTELAIQQATSAFNQARAKDEKAIRDAVVSRKKIPGNTFEVKAESDLKGALTAQRVTAGIRKKEAIKLVQIMRDNRHVIHQAMEQRVNAVAPKIIELLAEYQAELEPLLEELAEALTPAELLTTLDTRQSEDIGGRKPSVFVPGFDTAAARVNNSVAMVKSLARPTAPESIRLKDPHGNIGVHQLKGLNDDITLKLQQHVDILMKQGWTEVPWDEDQTV